MTERGGDQGALKITFEKRRRLGRIHPRLRKRKERIKVHNLGGEPKKGKGSKKHRNCRDAVDERSIRQSWGDHFVTEANRAKLQKKIDSGGPNRS